jgi:hypothetical protein
MKVPKKLRFTIKLALSRGECYFFYKNFVKPVKALHKAYFQHIQNIEIYKNFIKSGINLLKITLF